MKIAKLAGKLADPASAEWGAVEAAQVSLGPVALESQPTEYIREAWKGRKYGQTAQAAVKAASDGDKLYLRVEWADDAAPNKEFQDAVGAVFPAAGDGNLATLGSADKPVALWYWEDGRGALNLVSRGPGVVSKDAAAAVGGNGVLANGRWSVVISGPAAMAAKGKVGLAVWNGSNEERAGLAAVSQQWLPLESD